MAELLLLSGFLGVITGLVNVVYPLRFMRVRNRLTGAVITIASFVAFVVGVVMLPAPSPAPSTTTPALSAKVTPDKPLSGTTAGASTPTSEPTPTSNTQSQGTDTTPDRVEVPVVAVVDGDTIKVTYRGKEESVRLIGVDTPETVHPSRGVEPYGKEASDFTKKRLTGQKVQLEFDVEHRDQYGRLLAYVWIGEELYNATLVKEGYAQVATYPPNVKYTDLFVKLQQEAREGNKGLWAVSSSPSTSTTTAAKPSEPTPVPSPAPAKTEVRIVGLTSPISAGAYATVTAATSPNAGCSSTVIYKSGASTAAGLGPKTADAQGNVSWTWKVGTRTTPGSWSVIITCNGVTARTAITVR